MRYGPDKGRDRPIPGPRHEKSVRPQGLGYYIGTSVFTARGNSYGPMRNSHRLNLSVEGWRGLSHSYAVVNQWHLLELAKRQDVELRVKDLPFYRNDWRAQGALFPESQDSILRSIPRLSADFTPDVTWRTAFPYDFSPAASGKTVVFGTAEARRVDMQGGTTDMNAALANPAITVSTPSHWSAEGFRRLGFDDSRIAVIAHGVAPEMFERRADVRAAFRQKLGLSGFVFMNVVGPMSLNKGVDLLLRAFAAVAKRHKDARLFLKGSDELYKSRDQLSRMLAAFSAAKVALITERLVYNGQALSMTDMAALYQAADTYVSPYRAEGFNLPVLEAVASGVPVICTRGGSTDDFVAPAFARQIDSTLVTDSPSMPGVDSLEPETDHLIALMEGILTEESFRTQATAVGPAHVAAHFTWAHAVDKILARARALAT